MPNPEDNADDKKPTAESVWIAQQFGHLTPEFHVDALIRAGHAFHLRTTFASIRRREVGCYEDAGLDLADLIDVDC